MNITSLNFPKPLAKRPTPNSHVLHRFYTDISHKGVIPRFKNQVTITKNNKRGVTRVVAILPFLKEA